MNYFLVTIDPSYEICRLHLVGIHKKQNFGWTVNFYLLKAYMIFYLSEALKWGVTVNFSFSEVK
jgi:hypothetical protein